MNRKILIVTVPYEPEILKEVFRILIGRSFQYTFWHSMVPPHKSEFTFKGLSTEGIENYKSFFRESYKDSEYKLYCNFREIDNND